MAEKKNLVPIKLSTHPSLHANPVRQAQAICMESRVTPNEYTIEEMNASRPHCLFHNISHIFFFFTLYCFHNHLCPRISDIYHEAGARATRVESKHGLECHVHGRRRQSLEQNLSCLLPFVRKTHTQFSGKKRKKKTRAIYIHI